MNKIKSESEKIIDNNFDVKEGSFIYYLHEKSIFDKDSFQDLLSAINTLNKYYFKRKSLPRILCRKIVFISTSFNTMLHTYLDTNFRKDYRNHIYLEHFKYNEKLDSAIDYFFNGSEYKESLFEPYDKNAKL
jgi:hypothetical protein